jgi:hypothetical protein
MATILPDGWFSKENEQGYTYYYDIKGRVSWLPPPPRPLAPIKIITFKEEYSSQPIKEENEEEEEEYYDKWIVDEDDVGLPVRFPLKPCEIAQRVSELHPHISCFTVCNSVRYKFVLAAFHFLSLLLLLLLLFCNPISRTDCQRSRDNAIF